MPDIRVVNVESVLPTLVTMDWLQTSTNLLDETNELATAVMVALGSDRRANADDELPDPDNDDRRGWWGDTDAETIWGGWSIGSRLWLLERAKISDQFSRQGSTVDRAEMYVREALEPLVKAKIASRIDVIAARVGIDRIGVTATIYRGPLPTIELRFQSLWNEVG